MMKKILWLCLAVLSFSFVYAWWCYQPREERTGTIQTTQAVYMRSMPCMEEGWRVDIVRSGGDVQVIWRSDGWFKVQYNWQEWRVYRTFVSVDNTYVWQTTTPVTPPKPEPVEATPLPWSTLSPVIKEKIDSIIPWLKQNLTKKAADQWISYDSMKKTIVSVFNNLTKAKPQLKDMIDYIVSQL